MSSRAQQERDRLLRFKFDRKAIICLESSCLQWIPIVWRCQDICHAVWQGSGEKTNWKVAQLPWIKTRHRQTKENDDAIVNDIICAKYKYARSNQQCVQILLFISVLTYYYGVIKSKMKEFVPCYFSWQSVFSLRVLFFPIDLLFVDRKTNNLRPLSLSLLGRSEDGGSSFSGRQGVSLFEIPILTCRFLSVSEESRQVIRQQVNIVQVVSLVFKARTSLERKWQVDWARQVLVAMSLSIRFFLSLRHWWERLENQNIPEKERERKRRRYSAGRRRVVKDR